MRETGSKEKTSDWRKSFFPIWAGEGISLLGSTLVQFALIWYLTEQTGSGVVLATASIVGLLPEIFLGPIAGALVDRWSRRRVMIISDVAVAVVTLALAILFWTGWIQTWHIYAALFFRSLGGSFQWPAMMASTSLMVPEKHLPRIAGLNQALRGGLNVVGPPLGAMLMGLIPLYGVISIDIITLFFAIIPLLFIPVPQPEIVPSDEVITPRVILLDIGFGFNYLVKWPGMLAIVILAIFLNAIVNPAFIMLPLMVTEYFKGGPLHLGMLESFHGFGMIAGGLLMGVWGGFRKKIVTALAGTVGMGIAILLIGFTPADAFFMAVISLGVAGVMNTIENASFFAIFQAKIAPHMQGRVFTVAQSLIVAIVPLSLLVVGPLVDRLGVSVFFVIAGIGAIIGGGVGFFIPAIMGIEENGHKVDEANNEAKKNNWK